MSIIDFSKPTTGNFIVDIMLWLVQITSSIAGGVVLFTLLLKLITLPFDFFSRASMRKNSLKMEEMRPELEKLQKQYADNKELYNQKMMALYKKNGYSMFGACLPTILTLVIFIVAINGFTSYSQYQNRKYFYDMSIAYNNVIYSGLEADGNYIVFDKETGLTVKYEDLYKKLENGQTQAAVEGTKIVFGVEKKEIEEGKYQKYLFVTTENGYTKYKKPITVDEQGNLIENKTRPEYEIIESKLKALSDDTNYQNAYNNNLKIVVTDENGKDISKTFSEIQNAEQDPTKKMTAENFVLDICQYMSAQKFREGNASFLWVKNIWVTDSPMKNPVEGSWDSFKSTHAYPTDDGSQMSAGDYDNLIAKLDFEKSAPNGYFILVALTAGISLLMQFVMNKANKAQMELQTVDGQGAQTQKMMMWMMPIMMAIFAFMYTAAFSIYIILSNILSIGTTYGINFIVDRRFKKEKEKKDAEKIRGRVYTPKEEEKKEAENSKKNKAKEPPKNDFLSGTADTKHVRGRLK